MPSNYVLQRTPGTSYVSTYLRGPAPLNTALAPFMNLVYSSQDLAEAERVAHLLAQAGVQVHVSNRRTAEALGPQLSRFPASVGVWVTPSQADLAHQVLVAGGLITKRVLGSPSKLRPWLTVLFVLLVAALIVLAGGGL